MPLDYLGRQMKRRSQSQGDLHKIISIPAVNWTRELQEQQIRAVGYPQSFFYNIGNIVRRTDFRMFQRTYLAKSRPLQATCGNRNLLIPPFLRFYRWTDNRAFHSFFFIIEAGFVTLPQIIFLSEGNYFFRGTERKHMKDQIYVATFSENAIDVIRENGFNIELNDLCISENLDPEKVRDTMEEMKREITASGADKAIIHGPFTEIIPPPLITEL